MNSIKSAFIAVVLLVVLYGVWVMLNKKPLGTPPGMDFQAGWNPPQVDFGPAEPPRLGPPDIGGAWNLAQSPPQQTMASPPSPPPTTLSETRPEAPSTSPYWNDGTVQTPAGHSPPPVVGPEALDPTPQAPRAGGTAGSRYSAEPPEEGYGGSPAWPSSYGGRPDENARDDEYSADSRPFNAADRASAELAGTGFSIMWRGVQDQLAKGELAAALETLSLWYDSDDVPADMQPKMIDLLDQLAGEVVYSREHYLEEAHEVRPGEKLVDIARQYQVPWQLLANINGIDDPARLAPGTRLKVVRGPFNAVVHLERSELTLVVGGRYAGRFAVGIGNDPAPLSGEYVVREKDVQRTFYDREGRDIPPGDALNPYGPYWIGLGGQLAIHGAPPLLADGRRRSSTGSIIVEPDDARDLYEILSEDSQVIIRR